MYASRAVLLVADHNAQDRQRLRECFEREGFRVREAADGHSLLAYLQQEVPHLIVLDLQLPHAGGLDLCRRIKRHGDLPIVVLTALRDEEVKLKALDLYAEDFILKTVSCAEVVARVRRILRRTWLAWLSADAVVRVDERLSLDFLRREARTPEGTRRLTPLEAGLLEFLVRNAGQVLPSALLLERLWGDGSGPANSLWEYIRRVRHKIGDDAARPHYIVNEPGLGYRFCAVSSLGCADGKDEDEGVEQ